MSERNDMETQEEPLDPAIERIQIRLRRMLLRSSLIMVIGLGAVVAAIIYRLNDDAPAEPSFEVPTVVTAETLREARYPLPEGTTLTGMVFDNGQLAVSYEGVGGERGILLIDVASWQVHSVLDLSPSR